MANIDGLAYLPEDLFYLGLGEVAKRLSLAPLRRFNSLRRLYLERHTKDIDVISSLTNLTSLTLRHITLPDLAILVPLRRLQALELKLGGTRNLDLLPAVGELRCLEMWQVLGVTTSAPSAAFRRCNTCSCRHCAASPSYLHLPVAPS
jgi:internalin A